MLWTAVLAQEECDSTQSELRLNPVIETEAAVATSRPGCVSALCAVYPFINPEAGRIQLNGADWSGLAERFAHAAQDSGMFSVVCLGDSHVQADFAVSVLRERLQDERGKSGRGLVIPFRQAGTNQPSDYTFTVGGPVTTSKLLKRPWATGMPFTGIGVRPDARAFSVSVGCAMPFSRIRLFYDGSAPVLTSVSDGVTEIPFSVADSVAGETLVLLDRSLPSVILRMASDRTTVLAGAELLADTVGAVVHSIGNNGATYMSYNSIAGVGEGIARLSPDLIIVALGTNEAFGRTGVSGFADAVEMLVGELRESCPDARLLLVTPVQCYRKVYRRKGKKQRKYAVREVNGRIGPIRDAVMEFGRSHGVAVYDHYAVAGSAEQLSGSGLLSKDGVHFTAAAYRLWGALLGEALIDELRQEGTFPQ
ncbi:MAG: hypothetical protein K2J38_02320 [Muribaculaceae bacterium]|nr:hypothetical protein [Muribaculaceae bacterium]